MDEKRMLSLKEGMQYTSLKEGKFRTWAKEIGAARHIGRRVAYDKRVIDAALDALGA